MSFYSTVRHFDTALDNSNIKVDSFLEASAGIVTLVEKLGTAFKVVSSDMNGNIKKIRTKYEENKSQFEYLYELLKDEKDNKTKTQACEGALWLSRGLKFMSEFMQILVTNYKENKSEDSLKQPVKSAYEKTLKQFHGFIMSKSFSVVAMAAPSKKSLLISLSEEKESKDIDEEKIMQEMDVYQKSMVAVLEKLSQYFIDFGMETKSEESK